MKYLFLALTCLLFSLQFIFSKGFSRRASPVPHAGLWNGCVCSLLMVCYLLPLNHFQPEFSPISLLFSLLMALCALSMSLCNIPALQLGSLAVVTTYLLIGGMVLPFAYGVLFLQESCPPLKWVAIALLIAAILPNLLHTETADTAPRTTGQRVLFHALGLVLFSLNGATSILTTMHSLHPDRISSGAFTLNNALLQFTLTALSLLIYTLLRRLRGDRRALRSVWVDLTRETPATPGKLAALFSMGLGYALCNGVANIFSQESLAAGMESSVQFPVISGTVIVLSAVFGRVLFGERISRPTQLSLALSLAGAALFMLA